MDIFTKRLHDLRTDHDLNQTELANLLQCNQMHISRLERGQATPTPEEIRKLCKIFRVSADYIIGLL